MARLPRTRPVVRHAKMRTRFYDLEKDNSTFFSKFLVRTRKREGERYIGNVRRVRSKKSSEGESKQEEEEKERERERERERDRAVQFC